MPVPPRPPPHPPEYDSSTVSALTSSSWNSDGSFKLHIPGADQWLVEAVDAAGTCSEVFHGDLSEVQGYPKMPLSQAAHALVALGNYAGGGVWEDSGSNRFVLQRGESNELQPVPA
ncbi:MAG: hypothetical protein AAGH15_11010 [Myxococcota bacterium]